MPRKVSEGLKNLFREVSGSRKRTLAGRLQRPCSIPHTCLQKWSIYATPNVGSKIYAILASHVSTLKTN